MGTGTPLVAGRVHGRPLLATALVAAVFLLRAALTFALTAATSSATVETGIFISETLLSVLREHALRPFRQRRVAELQRRVTQLAKTVVSQVFRPGVQLVTDAAVIAAVLVGHGDRLAVGTLAAAMLVVGVASC